MAYQYAGRNWEGRAFSCSAAIRSLGAQVSALPNRSTKYDGTVASKAHDIASPDSDHRPTPYRGPGIVRAIDVTATIDQGNVWTDSLRLSEDPRISYVIWNGRKFQSRASSHPAWTWYKYLGPNPHEHHFHVSTLQSRDKDGSPWDLNGASNVDGPNGEPNWDKVSDWAKNSWTQAWNAGLLNNEKDDSKDSDPQDMLSKEELMVFLNRANVI